MRRDRLHDAVSCPLCVNVPHEPKLLEDETFVVVATKNAKGHSFRVMLATREHLDPAKLADGFESRAMARARDVGMALRGLDRGFAVYKDTYSSIPHHWHVIVADLEPGEDHEQVLATPRVVYDRASPEGRAVAPREPAKA